MQLDSSLLSLYLSHRNYVAQNIHFIYKKTEAQKGGVTRSDYTVSSWQSLEEQPAQWCFHYIIPSEKAL